MSPVSKTRKKKSKNKPATSRRADPPWFADANDRVVSAAGGLATAHGPRELEEATAALLGAELHRVIHEEQSGLRLDDWFKSLTRAAADRLTKPDAPEGLWHLLHGMIAIGPPSARPAAEAASNRVNRNLTALPDALAHPADGKALARVWRLEDGYGTRIAFAAEFTHPAEPAPWIYLVDVDARGLVTFAGAGAYDDLDAAAQAWRTLVGEAANEATPREVRHSDELLALAQLSFDQVIGDETRAQTDNWFRARARIHDIAQALRATPTPLPAARYLFDGDSPPLAEEFTTWYADRHGAPPDAEQVEMLAEEWVAGSLPEVVRRVSPDRLAYYRIIIEDTYERGFADELLALFPDWTRWLGEGMGLAPHLLERALLAAGADQSGSASSNSR